MSARAARRCRARRPARVGGLSLSAPWVAAGLGFVAVVLASLLERTREPAYAADRALARRDARRRRTARLLRALRSRVSERARDALCSIRSHVTAPIADALSLGVSGALALSCAAVERRPHALAAAIGARGFGDPAVASDALASLWSGALAGAAYAGLFAVASLFGRRGRIVALVLDWLFGSGAGLARAALAARARPKPLRRRARSRLVSGCRRARSRGARPGWNDPCCSQRGALTARPRTANAGGLLA